MADYKIKLKKISCLKTAFLFALFGIISGLLLGLGVFIFLNLSVNSMEMDVGISGMILVGFLVIPVCIVLISFVSGLLFGLCFNLFLRIIGGMNMVIEELE